MTNHKYSDMRGFSLLELLVVVGIVGILIAIAVVAFVNFQIRSRDNKRIADLKMIQKALEQYYLDNDGSYPTVKYNNASLLNYIPNPPKDPKVACYYQYSSGPAASGYEICADLEGQNGYSCSVPCLGASCQNDYCLKQLQE